jgi:multidrug resistance efflux pump
MGSSGLGTSAETLPGGGVPGGSNSGGGGGSPGGGGGGGDFGLVLQHLIKPGSLVKKGDLLAEFDRQYMMNRLDDYRAGVEQDERSLKRLKAELDVSRQAHAQSILSAKGAMEKADLDLKSLPVRSAIESERFRLAKEEAVARYKQLLSEVKFVQVSEKSQLRVQEIELEQAKVELKRAEANADRMVAKAPIDGLVVIQSTRRGTELGQFQQGDQVYPGQFYMQIVDTRSMVINAFVNQADSERIRIGARARVRFDAYPDLELPARVYSVGAMTKSGGMRASYMKELPVKVKLEKMDPRVIPDLSVSVDVIEETEQAAAIVPREAIFRDASDQAPHVYVRGEGGWERREIELGPVNHVAAIVRRGLNAGEVLAADRPYLPAKQN